MKKIERLGTLLEKKVRMGENFENQSGAHPTPADIASEPNIDRR